MLTKYIAQGLLQQMCGRMQPSGTFTVIGQSACKLLLIGLARALLVLPEVQVKAFQVGTQPMFVRQFRGQRGREAKGIENYSLVGNQDHASGGPCRRRVRSPGRRDRSCPLAPTSYLFSVGNRCVPGEYPVSARLAPPHRDEEHHYRLQ